MRSVVAFDVSKKQSYMGIYDEEKSYIFEKYIKHCLSEFEVIRSYIEAQMTQDGIMLYSVFQATSVYSKAS